LTLFYQDTAAFNENTVNAAVDMLANAELLTGTNVAPYSPSSSIVDEVEVVFKESVKGD
jgi:hypothetical protein